MVYKSPPNSDVERLVEENQRLVTYVAKRYLGYTKDPYAREEILSEGKIGLVKAAQRFDMNRGTKFSTYAVPMIDGEIRRYLRDSAGGDIRIPRAVMNKKKIFDTYLAEHEFRIMDSKEQVMADMGLVDEKEYQMFIKYATTGVNNLFNLNDIVGQPSDKGGAREYGEMIEDTNQSIDETLNGLFVGDLINTVLSFLDEKLKQVFMRRFIEEKSQTEIGDELGISQAQISRDIRKIIEICKIKKHMIV